MSFLREIDFADVRQEIQEGFDHTVTTTAQQRVELPNGETEWGPLVPTVRLGLLTRPSLRAREQAAAQGVTIHGVLKLPLDGRLPVGTEATVTGTTADVAWTRRVRVTGSLRGDRINSRYAVEDIALNTVP